MRAADDEKLEVLVRVPTMAEAEIVQGLLEAEGIESALFGNDAGGQLPSLDALAGVAVLVRRADLERARAALVEGEEFDEDEAPPE